MYVPPSFAAQSLNDLHVFMEQNSFATLVTRRADGSMVASHIPLLLVRDGSAHATLLGHIARANDQWKDAAGEALAIFQGPHVYVSPRWYEARGVVPTWNYVAVHAYGSLQLISDPEELREMLRLMVQTYETGVENPWTIERSGDAVDKMIPAVVGFRIAITRLDGKWKLSQNHPEERQEKVIAALEQQGGEDASEIASLMRTNLKADQRA